ncbi:MAG: hypothetical protein OHK0022_19490 [Roseiflexaceae bacterium]
MSVLHPCVRPQATPSPIAQCSAYELGADAPVPDRGTRRRTFRWYYSCVLIGLAVLIGALGEPAVSQSQAIESVAIMFVIDNSGSMTGEGSNTANDRGNLRYAATRLIMEVADSSDEIGVVCFGDTTTPILSLAPLGDDTNRRSKIAQITEARCGASGGTNMGPAINEARSILEGSAAQHKYLLLLTDGAPTDERETTQALVDLRNSPADITLVLAVLNPSGVGNFTDAVESYFQIRARQIPDDSALLRSFASIYADLKPDRYVDVLASGSPALTVSGAQEVNRMVLVLKPGQTFDENDQRVLCDGNSRCRNDIEQKYVLYSSEGSPLQGRWRVSDEAVVITRTNFRSQLLYPPANDAAEQAFYIRPDRQTLIALIDRPIPAGTALAFNGVDISPLSTSSGSLLLQQSNTAISTLDTAEVRLGSDAQPLVVRKRFELRPVPDAEPDLPQLAALNPDAQGAVQTENDTGFRLQVKIAGNLDLAPSVSVQALVVSETTGQPIFGPEPLEGREGGVFQSRALLTIAPGERYRTVVWMRSIRARDGLRYGDVLDSTFVLGGQIRVQGLRTPNSDDFSRGALPLTISVTEPNRSVELNARLTMTAGAQGLFDAMLKDRQFSGQSQTTELLLTAPADLCALPEGRYSGTIELASPSGLAVVPSSISFDIPIVYGDVKVATTEQVNLGNFCTLGWLCRTVFGEEPPATARLKVDVPACVSATDVQITPDRIVPSDQTLFDVQSIDRTVQPPEFVIIPQSMPPVDNMFGARERFVGRLMVGRAGQRTQDFAQVEYAKLSLWNVLTPLPFQNGPVRVGTLLGCLTVFLLSLPLLAFFGVFSPRRTYQKKNRKRSTETRGPAADEPRTRGAGAFDSDPDNSLRRNQPRGGLRDQTPIDPPQGRGTRSQRGDNGGDSPRGERRRGMRDDDSRGSGGSSRRDRS